MKGNKKGFTLVELLAVMVIISVLLLLALPAVTKQIELAKKRTFAEDAHTIANAVKDDLLVGDKSLDSYSNLEQINSLLDKKLGKSPFGGDYEHASAQVTVSRDDITGKRNYTIRICLVDTDGNGFGYSNVENLDAESIVLGGVGPDCKSSNDATIVVERNNRNNSHWSSTTVSTGSQGSGNSNELVNPQAPDNQEITESRFIGTNLSVNNNYLYFNCSDTSNQTSSTCEVYRIMGEYSVDNGSGVFEKRLKLISVAEVKAPAPNSGKWSSNGKNDWTQSTLMNYLNTTYLNNINEKYRNLIGSTKYYLGGSPNANVTRAQMYNYERKQHNDSINYYHTYNEDHPTWTGKIGLMYASDFGFATEDAERCASVPLSQYNNDNASGGGCGDNWIWRIDDTASPSWLITQVSSTNNDAYYIGNTGMSTSASVSESNEPAHPVFYLTATAEIVGGNGTKADPYRLFK